MKRVFYPMALVMALLTIVPQINVFATKHVVTVQNFSFSPSSISNVQLGDTIRWVWASGTHTTTSTTIPAGAAIWDNPITSSVTSYEYKVLVAGTFNYKCTPHASMGMVASFTAVSATLPGPAGPISGPSSVCKNSNASFSVGTITGATSYVWTVPTGATITAGQGTTSITANFGSSAVSGNVSVHGTNGAGSGTSSNLLVAVNSVPSQPSVIGGSVTPCTGSSQIYSVTNVSGVVYNWTVPAGSTITAGQGTNSITATMGTSSGNINVVPSNSCGGGAEQIKAITIQLLPGTAGAITGPSLVDLATVVATEYATPGATDATSYQWEISPAGAGTISGTGLTSIVTWTGSFLGVAQVRVKAINTCGEGEWSEVKSIEVINTTGIADLSREHGIKVYPSPSNGAFTVALNGFEGRAKLRIVDTKGNELYSTYLAGEKLTQLEYRLSPGIYLLLVDEGIRTMRQKLVIQ
jgi:plastocyanin